MGLTWLAVLESLNVWCEMLVRVGRAAERGSEAEIGGFARRRFSRLGRLGPAVAGWRERYRSQLGSGGRHCGRVPAGDGPFGQGTLDVDRSGMRRCQRRIQWGGLRQVLNRLREAPEPLGRRNKEKRLKRLRDVPDSLNCKEERWLEKVLFYSL